MFFFSPKGCGNTSATHVTQSKCVIIQVESVLAIVSHDHKDISRNCKSDSESQLSHEWGAETYIERVRKYKTYLR